MIRRTLDASLLNRVVNDPSVRPHVGGGTGPLELGPLVDNARNFALQHEHGGFVFVADEAGRYEMHTMLLPLGRGAAALASAREALRYMFTTTDCLEVITKVPATNPAADLMARRVGFAPMFARAGAWEGGAAVTYFNMTIDAWRAHDDKIAAEGHSFHEMIETAKAVSGSSLPTHPDDDAHDRAAGAACLMAKAGNAGKAVWSYNRWARFAGYQTIDLVSAVPPAIDVRDAVLTVRDGRLEVLSCR